MSFTKYIIKKLSVNRPSQEFVYSDLTDEETEESLPEEFEDAPFIAIIGKYQTTGGKISVISTTGFTIKISGRWKEDDVYYFNLKIEGEL